MTKRVMQLLIILLGLFINSCDLSQPEEEEKVKIGIPKNVKFTKIDDESLKLSWDSVSDGAEYEVAFAKEGDDWSYATVAATSNTFSSLSPGTYQAKVRVVVGETYGDFSALANIALTVDTSSYSGIFSSGEVNITGNSGDLISNTLEVTGINLVNELIVKINVDHDLLDFCDVSLTAPDGTWIYLTEGEGGGAGKDYINTVFDDKAETFIYDSENSAPYTGTYKPRKALSTFKGIKADGTWTLRVYDEGSGYSFSIKSWDLAFNGEGFSMEGADDVVELTLGQWSAEEIEAGIDSVWFSLEVTPGEDYVFMMDEGESGEGTGNYTLDVKANIYAEDKTTKVVNTSDIWNAYTYPNEFTIPAGVNKIFIEVDAATANTYGTFAVRVSEPETTPVVNGIASSGTLNSELRNYSDSIYEMDIDGVGTISEVKVRLNLTYGESLSYIDVKLQSPDATTAIELSTANGGWGEEYINTVFDDDASASITTGSGTFTGSFKPEEALSTFDGGSANGTWKLILTNSRSYDATLVSWDLAFNGADFDGNSTPASTDATLSSLTLSNGSISFSSSTEDYSIDVENSVDSLTVTPTVNDSGATVTVEGSTVTSGSSSSAISLTVGVAKEINIVVTAEDGTTSKEYTVTVTRKAPVISGVDLVIAVDDIYQSGDQTYIDYTITNQGDTDITGDDNYFHVKVGPDYDSAPALDSSHYAESLYYYGLASIRKSTIKAGESVTGTANFDIEDAGFGTYFGGNAYAWIDIASSSAFTDVDLTNNITGPIVWGNDPGDWTDSNLSVIGEEDWYKIDVVSGVKYYIQGTEDIDQSFADIKVDLMKDSSTSIESKDIDHNTYIVWTADLTGTVYLKAFADGYFDYDKTGIYSLRVFSENGGAVLTATDDPSNSSTPASTDATLSSLTLSNGSISFSNSTENYTVNVENSVDTITVTPTVNDSGATVTVEGSTVTSGSSSSAISLTAGVAEEINIIVIAEDGTTSKEYTVTVTRAVDMSVPQWTTGELLTSNDENWYSFNVTSGTEYTMTVEDFFVDYTLYTADVVTDLIRYTHLVNFIVKEGDYYDDTLTFSFVASENETLYIRITGYSGTRETGTYALNVKDASGTNIALTETEKKQAEGLEGSITAGGETWFAVPGYANIETLISWKDNTSEYANIKVSAYPNSSGINAYFEDVDLADGYPERLTPTSDGTIYIKVTGYDSTEAGNFLIQARNNDIEYFVITKLN